MCLINFELEQTKSAKQSLKSDLFLRTLNKGRGFPAQLRVVTEHYWTYSLGLRVNFVCNTYNCQPVFTRRRLII